MKNNDLSKSKIININDFIFRQNLEFYPNLKGITCEDNVLTYDKGNGEIERETLTFDLRTLPGGVWNFNSENFMKIIKFNKDCLTLGDVADYVSEHALKRVLESGEVA